MAFRRVQSIGGRVGGRLLPLVAALLTFSLILMGGFHTHVPHAEAGTHIAVAQDGHAAPCAQESEAPADEACCVAAAGCGLFAVMQSESFIARLSAGGRDIVPTPLLRSAVLGREYPPPRPLLA
jgi:hypothetical protein